LRFTEACPTQLSRTVSSEAITQLDVQYLLGHSTPAMVRRYSATYDAEKAAQAHERFGPADRMAERLG